MKRNKTLNPKQASLIISSSEEIVKKRLRETKKDIKQIFLNVRNNISQEEINRMLIDGWKNWELKGDYLKEKAKPEDFTQDYVIIPLLKILGYSENDWVRQKKIEGVSGEEWPDFELKLYGLRIPLEIKPLNQDINKAIKQVEKYMKSRVYAPKYGIATNGIVWVLKKFIGDKENKKLFENRSFSLETIRNKYLFNHQIEEKNIDREIIKFFSSLSKDRLLKTFERKSGDKLGIEKPTFLDDYI